MANNAKQITKKNWVSNFSLVGKPKINDYTFKIDEQSTNSSWIYNSMNLGIDCGEKHGIVYCSMMGGYSAEKESVIYAHAKDENGRDDFSVRMEIPWGDRNDEDVIETVGDMCFINIGIEKTLNGKTFTKKFLSAYDAIAYVKENLNEDVVIRVNGRLKYSMYNDNVQVNKEVTSIYLSKIEDPNDFNATFTQTILIDKDSASLKEVDKEKSIMYVNSYVLDYMRELNGVEVRGQYPYPKQFEYILDLGNPEKCKKIYEKLFRVKKGYTQITFEGNIVEGGATITATWDDVPDDIKDLVETGIYSKEEALKECSASGSREQRMILNKPLIRIEGDGENKTPVLQIFTEAYNEDDLDMSWLYIEDDEDEDDEIPFENEGKEDDSSTGEEDVDDWFSML